ncbi:unnamed protein product, partial [marine sediment metagenome]
PSFPRVLKGFRTESKKNEKEAPVTINIRLGASPGSYQWLICL